ncbi:MAG: hypothetical protein ACPL1D_02400 [Microgenomates group bacterium]
MLKKISAYYFITIFLIILLFILLTPKLSVKIFPFLREMKFKNFNNYLLNTENFDPQVFWQFREFFCPGYFIFRKEGISIKSESFLKNNQFLKNLDDINLFFAKYHCSYLASYEGLATRGSLDDFLNQERLERNVKIFRKTKEFIFFQEKDTKNYYIISLLDGEKMKKAVGFFDYGEKDRELVREKKWITITKIKNENF